MNILSAYKIELREVNKHKVVLIPPFFLYVERELYYSFTNRLVSGFLFAIAFVRYLQPSCESLFLTLRTPLSFPSEYEEQFHCSLKIHLITLS